MRFSLGKTGVYRRWKRKEGRKRKEESIARFEREGRIVEEFMRRHSVFRVRVTGDSDFFLFSSHWIYIQFRVSLWAGEVIFGKVWRLTFPLKCKLDRVTFSNRFFPRSICLFFFFFLPILTTLRIFFFFLKFRNRTLKYDECPRIDRAIIMIEIGRGFFSDLLFIRVLIIRRGRAAPLPFLLNNFNIRVNTRRDISSGNTLIASREVGRIG